MCVFFFFKQKTAYEMRISDWSSDVCSSDLLRQHDIFDRVEIWQQMMELIDEADLLAPRLRPLALFEARDILAIDADRTAESAFAQADCLQHRRLAPPRRAEQRDDLAAPQRRVDAAQHLDRDLALTDAAVQFDPYQPDIERKRVVSGKRLAISVDLD